MSKKLIFLTSFLLVLGLVIPNVAFADVIEVRIADEFDDSEEDIDPGKLGENDADSSDLEMPYEDAGMGDPQLIGLRYQVDIPKGATITDAWVRFQVDELKDGSLPVNLIIEGELSPNADAFVEAGPGTFDISSRARTTAQVQWSVANWENVGDQGDAQTSTNIASVIQEIVNQDGWASGNSLVLIITDDPANPSEGNRVAEGGPGDDSALLHVEFTLPVTIIVEEGGDIAAANEQAKAGDTIEIAAGTYVLTSQIEIKSGVTYRGAGPGLTIIDGNDVTRAFTAFGDRSVANGQVDADGLAVPNNTGPKNWVLEGMTIQNCVADTVNRYDILGSARDLLNNYTGTPYTLVTAQDENGGITNNPEWFDILSGGADDDLSDVELQAYLDGNPVGSAGHLVVNDDKDGDGGAITIHNESVGTIANCDFLNNHTPAEGDGDDGGAININGRSTITINDCFFNGNYACSPDSVSIDGADGDGGHIKAQGNNLAGGFIEVGTTLIVNRCVFMNGNAEDDGGAIQATADGIVVRIDSCWFEGNTSWDNGNVLQFPDEDQNEVTVTNCVFANNITNSDNSPDRMCEVRRNTKFVNCTFVGNVQEDQDLIYNNANDADGDDDGTDDEMADTTQVVNCIFVNNVVGNGDDVLGSRNDNFSIAATNCLFFGNTLQNGDAADNTQRPDVEVGSVLSDPLLDADLVPGAGSEAIDGGVDPATVGVTLTNDYNGTARPKGAAYDIGAIESE